MESLITSVFYKNLVTELIYFYVILICRTLAFRSYLGGGGGGWGLLVHHINTNLLTKAQRTLSCIWFLTNFYKKSRPFLPKSVQAFKNEYSKIVGVLLYNVFIIFV